MIKLIKRSPKSSLNIIEIIKTTNLTDNISQKIINNLKLRCNFPFSENAQHGFIENFLFSEKKVVI